jgi:hypothetical protein
MTQPRDLLNQAATFLRAQPEPGWDAIADRVIAAVRATPSRSGWPLLARPIDESGDGQIFISDQVVRTALVFALRQQYMCAPTAIEFDIDDGTLVAVHIQIIGSYGTELRNMADRIRATTIGIVANLLGTPTRGRRPIDITITDVVAGDPLHI